LWSERLFSHTHTHTHIIHTHRTRIYTWHTGSIPEERGVLKDIYICITLWLATKSWRFVLYHAHNMRETHRIYYTCIYVCVCVCMNTTCNISSSSRGRQINGRPLLPKIEHEWDDFPTIFALPHTAPPPPPVIVIIIILLYCAEVMA